jgi:hypothetical protein
MLGVQFVLYSNLYCSAVLNSSLFACCQRYDEKVMLANIPAQSRAANWHKQLKNIISESRLT